VDLKAHVLHTTPQHPIYGCARGVIHIVKNCTDKLLILFDCLLTFYFNSLNKTEYCLRCIFVVVLPTMIHAPNIINRTATSLTVNWRDWKAGPERGSGPVSGYVLYYKPLDSTQWLSTQPNITRPFTVSGLASNQQYSVKVAAVHQSGAIGSPSPNISEKTCGSMLWSLYSANFI